VCVALFSVVVLAALLLFWAASNVCRRLSSLSFALPPLISSAIYLFICLCLSIAFDLPQKIVLLIGCQKIDCWSAAFVLNYNSFLRYL